MRPDTPQARPGETLAPRPCPAERATGLHFVRRLDEQLRHLHAVQAHPNRTLFYDQVVVAHLLAFFNPHLDSLRKLEDAFEHRSVRKHFGSPRVPKSTLADAQRVFDPTLLRPVIATLQHRVAAAPYDARLDDVTRQLLAVDGSFFAVAPRVAWALYNQTTRAHTDRPVHKGQVRGHFQFDVRRGIPTQVALTDGRASEAEQLRVTLTRGCLYLIDRGFQQYQLLRDILKAGSDFVVRLRKSAALQPLQTLALTPADLHAGVLSDTLVQVGWRDDQTPLTMSLRCVRLTQVAKPETPLRLLTNRTDLPAHLIGLLYRYRWQVELFFRWLKCMAGFRHFLSESPEGMSLQIYAALIGTLLIALETGQRPSRYDYALMSLALTGLAPWEEILATAARRRAERQRAAERAQARAAARKNAW
jgi:hypothetical protein